MPAWKCCRAASLSLDLELLPPQNAECAFISFSASCSESESGIFRKCLFRGLTRVGLRSSVDLQMPIPGLKEHNKFRHSLGPTIPHPCAARCRGLRLTGERDRGRGRDFPRKCHTQVRSSSRQEKQSKSYKLGVPSFCCL